MSYEDHQRITGVLVAAIAVAVIGSSFQYGYNIAVVNAPAKLIRNHFFADDDSGVTTSNNDTATKINSSIETTTERALWNVTNTNGIVTATVHHEEEELSDYETFLWSFTVSIYTVGGMIGSYITGILVKPFGRKGTLLFINVFSIVGGILMGTSKVANSLIMIIVARFLLGLFAGLATTVVPLYLGEISPKKYRGGIGVINQLLITIGILSAQILSLNELLGTKELWPFLLAFTAVPSVMQLCTLPFLPESPRCLLIDRKDEEKSRKALQRFRGTKDISQEVREMTLEAQAEAASEQMSVIEVFKDDTIRWQLISIITLQITQQLCGINAIFFYLNSIFTAAGLDDSVQNYASVGVGAVNVLMTVVSVLLMDRAGRRLLLGSGYVISAFFCILMTISLNLQHLADWISWISVVSVIGFIVGFAIGPGPVPWILMAELFRQSARPAASAIACGFNWTFNFFLALVFPFMQKAMGAYVFLFFLAVCVFAATYVFAILPETKHKTFQEINLMFAKRNKLKQTDLEMDEERDRMVIN